MAYATESDFRTAFTSAEADQFESRDQAGSGAIAAALDEASGIIDSYLAAVFQLPLSGTYPKLRRACLSGARYLLLKDGLSKESDTYIRWQDFIAWLKDVAAGRALVVDATGAVPAMAGVTAIPPAAGTPVLSVTTSQFQSQYGTGLLPAGLI